MKWLLQSFKTGDMSLVGEQRAGEVCGDTGRYDAASRGRAAADGHERVRLVGTKYTRETVVKRMEKGYEQVSVTNGLIGVLEMEVF